MDISAEVAAIQAASQGSELRQPLVGALNKLNSGTLPTVTASDVGKILRVGANGWELSDKSGYIPITQADEGKVLQNGVLVSQTSKTITQNGTYDTTANDIVIVNTSGVVGIYDWSDIFDPDYYIGIETAYANNAMRLNYRAQHLAGRALSSHPLKSSGYLFKVTDSTKYNICLYDIESDIPVAVYDSSNRFMCVGYSSNIVKGATENYAWVSQDSVNAPYAFVYLKKMDNTDFTQSEIKNAYGVVFTIENMPNN